ncbi:MAG: protein kinase, partial [Anaerolineales bacterium]|nr:protein kinase [Anaerolineales bacterium]
MEDLTGRQLGPYQIVAPLGEGGMAAVFRAYQPGMERYVALKVLPRQFAEDPEFSARFQREARILAQLQHPHILPVFDYGQVEGYSFIVMPFVPSGTLTDSIQGQPLPLPRIRQVISQVGDALSYAHGRGLVHRDVKPSNVLIDESGNCLLTDFGLARMVETNVNLTAIGTLMGTPAYMSPEQGSGSKIDSRSDIYSLGIILYEMATGRVPYRAETPVAVVFMHTSAPLPLPRSVNPDLPEAVERVILKALARNPDDRYQTAEDLVAALKRAIPETPMVTSKPEPRLTPRPKPTHRGASPTLVSPPAGGAIPPLARKRRIPGWAWASAILLLGLVAAGGMFLASRIKTRLESAAALFPPHPTASALPPTYGPVKTMSPAGPTPTARPAPTERPALKIKVGEVTEMGTVYDKALNALGWKGV